MFSKRECRHKIEIKSTAPVYGSIPGPFQAVMQIKFDHLGFTSGAEVTEKAAGFLDVSPASDVAAIASTWWRGNQLKNSPIYNIGKGIERKEINTRTSINTRAHTKQIVLPPLPLHICWLLLVTSSVAYFYVLTAVYRRAGSVKSTASADTLR